jgi:hypothetical protein
MHYLTVLSVLAALFTLVISSYPSYFYAQLISILGLCLFYTVDTLIAVCRFTGIIGGHEVPHNGTV